MAEPAAEIRLPRAAWVLLALFAMLLVVTHERLVVRQPDAARFTFDGGEYALAGRAWLETGRLVTPFVHPAALGDSPGPPYPLLVGHPLVPALDALAFALTGTSPDATLLPAMLAFVITVLLTARLALVLTGSRAAALAAAAACALHPWALRYATEGLSEMPFAALYTAALVVLAGFRSRPRPVLLGVLLGVAHLARPVAVPLLPAFALGVVLLAPPARRAVTLLRAALAFGPFAVALAFYYWSATGSPFPGAGGYLLLTGVDAEHAITRLNRMAPPPDALAWIRAHPGLWLAKLVRNAGLLLSNGSWLAGRPFVVLALATGALLARRREARSAGFVLAVAAGAALVFALSAATVADSRMLFPFLPVTLVLAFTGLARVAEGLARGRRAAVAALLALCAVASAWPLARTWRQAAASERPVAGAFQEREWRGIGQAVRTMLPGDGLVASDAAPWIGWYVPRPVTLVPLAPDSLLTGPARLRPDAVVLTNEWLIHRPDEPAWRECFERRTSPRGYTFAGHARAGRLEAVVFRREGAPD